MTPADSPPPCARYTARWDGSRDSRWLHTCEIGTLDDDRYMRITDRKKDTIVLSGGENVSAAKVQAMLMAQPEIAQAVVAGDGRSSLTALAVPSQGLRIHAVTESRWFTRVIANAAPTSSQPLFTSLRDPSDVHDKIKCADAHENIRLRADLGSCELCVHCSS